MAIFSHEALSDQSLMYFWEVSLRYVLPQEVYIELNIPVSDFEDLLTMVVVNSLGTMTATPISPMTSSFLGITATSEIL